jgi:hypothetical protein
MANEQKDHTATKYVVCHNGSDVFHYAKVKVGQVCTSGQPNMALVASEEAAQTLVANATGNADYWNTHYVQET